MSTPAFRVIADGKDVTSAIADRLLSIRVVDKAGQLSDSLEIALDDRDRLMPIPRSGSWIRVWLGYSREGQLPVYMGAYAVDEVEMSMGPRGMVIKATAAQTAPTLVKQQRTQSWHMKKLGEICAEIAGRNGLGLVIKGDLGKIEIKHEDQTNESDQSFLTRLAEKYKATIKPADGKLIVVPRAGSSGQFSVTLEETTTWRCTLKNRGDYKAVKVKYMERKTNTEKIWINGGGAPVFEEKQLFRDLKEAQEAAASRLQSLTAGEVRINLSMPGKPALNADGSITLRGFRKGVDGTWVIQQVTHELTNAGLTTHVDCGTKGAGGGGGGSGTGGWASNPGVNNAASSEQKAQLVANAAEKARGINTKGGPDAGNNACVYAVSNVLRGAGITPPWGNSNYVPDARAALAQGGGTLLSGPEPGAIAIMRDNGNPPYPHMGIVQNDGNIISNSSSRGTFSWVASPSSYDSYYGGSTEYWRLK